MSQMSSSAHVKKEVKMEGAMKSEVEAQIAKVVMHVLCGTTAAPAAMLLHATFHLPVAWLSS